MIHPENLSKTLDEYTLIKDTFLRKESFRFFKYKGILFKIEVKIVDYDLLVFGFRYSNESGFHKLFSGNELDINIAGKSPSGITIGLIKNLMAKGEKFIKDAF